MGEPRKFTRGERAAQPDPFAVSPTGTQSSRRETLAGSGWTRPVNRRCAAVLNFQ